MKLGLRRPIVFAIGVLVVAGVLLVLDACTPAERQRLEANAAQCAPALADTTCFVLDVLDAPFGDRPCVVAHELAALVGNPDAGTARPVRVLATRQRKPPVRHCAAWVYVDAGGYTDGARSDGSARRDEPSTGRDDGGQEGGRNVDVDIGRGDSGRD